ncbi:MAG TPA: ATP-dependent RNA helicase RhlB, partial [Luteimonas sp.]|nr:ATP-dependent RNA helicase RhlB [Luteimonas sp.]
RGPRPPRKPDAAPRPVTETPPVAAVAALPAEGERAPRKRRRRRGGRKLEGSEGMTQNVAAKAPSKPAAKSAPVSSDASPSLLTRIGRGLKKLVTRAPRAQH